MEGITAVTLPSRDEHDAMIVANMIVAKVEVEVAGVYQYSVAVIRFLNVF